MLDSGSTTLIDHLRFLLRNTWRRRGLAVTVAWIVGLAGVLAYPLVPQRFEATARIYVDTMSVLKPLMAGLAYQPDLDQQVRMLSRTVISRPNLERLVTRSELGLPNTTEQERESTLNMLMKRIQLVPSEAGLYTISYRDTSPERAERVVQATLALFVKASSGNKRRDSTEARRFIEEQIASYETKLIDAEGRLKAFKVNNFGVSGVSNQDYFVRMSALADELTRLTADLRAAERARDTYRRELAAEDPQLPRDLLLAAGGGAMIPESEVRLAAEKKNLNELLRRFTDLHPDVIASRRQIQTLEAQRNTDVAVRASRGSAGANNGSAATSPVYQRLRVALAETEAQVSSLQSRVSAERERLAEVRALAGRVPQVEAELAQLNRDYDVIRKNYEQLVERRESAALGVKLDVSSQLTDFRIVEPPRVADSSVFPGRMALAAMVIGLSLLAGLLAPAIAEFMRPTVEDSRGLSALTGRPVLGSVSLSLGRAATARMRRGMAAACLAAVALLVSQSAWLAWVVSRPLT